jgi:hypothetical protein
MAIPCFAVPFRLIGLKIRTFVTALLPQLSVTAVMVLSCLAWLHFLRHMSVLNSWAQLISTSAVGAACYMLGIFLFAHQALDCLEEILHSGDNALFRRILFVIQRFRIRSFFRSTPIPF